MPSTSSWNTPQYNPGDGNVLTYRIRAQGPIFQGGGARVKLALRRALKRTLEHGKRIVKVRTPVRTGLLQRGWRYRTEERAIYNEVPYSIFVEYGTRRMEARAMASNSLAEIEEFYVDAISEEIKRSLGG